MQNKTFRVGRNTKQNMKDFIQFLEAKDLSKTTIEIYLRYVNGFLDWYKQDPINCEKKDILSYLAYLKNKKNHENSTRKNTLLAINHYYTFLLKKEQIGTNPTTFLKIRGANKKKLYQIFSLEELTQLADNYHHNFIRNYQDNHIPKNQKQQSFLSKQRNYTMLQLLVFQGIQTNELQKITLADLDLTKAQIHITGSKKSNERNLFLTASQMGTLINYTQNIRPQFLEFCTDSEALFLPLPEAGRSKTNSTNLMGTLKQLTAHTRTLDKNFLNFKQIRASVITYWIQTLGLRKAQYNAGHRYISSTENYLPNDLESLTEDIAKFNPF